MRTSLWVVAALAAPLALAAASARARTIEQQVAADPRGEVDVSSISGTIAVTGWDQPQVAVSAELSSDHQRVEVTSAQGRTSVRVVYGEHGVPFWSGGGDVRLTVHVPRQSEVDVSAVSASVDTKGIQGTQRLQTVSGSVAAQLGSGNDEVKSVSGNIELTGSGEAGYLHVTTVSGEVSITHTAGELEATTVSGPLHAQLAPAHSVRLHTTSGAITLTTRLDSGGQIEAETVSGSIQVHASAAAGYEYEVRTFSGDIENCFSRQAERTSQYGPGWRLNGTWNGTLGGGSAHIRIKSLSGTVSLCDH